MTDYQISLDKTLVLDVCEPYMVVENVRHLAANDSFQIFVFGHFEVDDEEYIFGCEENEYKYCLEHDKKGFLLLSLEIIGCLECQDLTHWYKPEDFIPKNFLHSKKR